MNQSHTATSSAKVIAVLALVVLLSFLFGSFAGEKAEKGSSTHPLVVNGKMTVGDFGKQNGVDRDVLKKIFGLKTEEDLAKTVSSFRLTENELTEAVTRERTLGEEYEPKNWILIPVKFALWIILLVIVFVSMRKSAINATFRSVLYLVAVVVFGAVLGSDPSPMGTVKDAVVLLGTKGVIFPPRLIAMTIFLIFTLVANKFICSWGCQFGTLQDLVFRLYNSHRAGRKQRPSPRYKLPFAISNSVRVATFVALSVGAFAWGVDLMKPFDPFKIFRPATIGLSGAVFGALLLIASAFVYRPWCHLFCPFGLVGWLVEKISIFKIKVNYNTCIGCEACARSCPSTVMDAILKRTRVIPDCYSCGTCIETCPTKSIRFDAGKRAMPPEGKFSSKKARS